VIDLGGLLERAWGLLFGERAEEGEDGRSSPEAGGEIQRVSADDGTGGTWDPNG
jgi:hypothetical protein